MTARRKPRGELMLTPEEVELFWKHVARRGPDDCWPWTGCVRPNGYGNCRYGGFNWYPHRLAWAITHGMRDPDQDVLHACDTPLCCNPFSTKHLFEGSQQANVLDMVSKLRHARAGGGAAKLSLELAEAVRVAHGAGIGVRCLARVCGVAPGTISMLVNGLTWHRNRAINRALEAASAPPASAPVHPYFV